MSSKKYIHAVFKASYPNVEEMPNTKIPEFAFIGRSNVGKSSLINYLTNQKKLAMISGKPGKTKHIVYFEVDKKWALIDLPGYGYAKVSKTDRADFENAIRNYFVERKQLFNAFILIDSNVLPQKIDLEFINFLGESEIPFSLVFTKSDRKKPEATKQSIQIFLDLLNETWHELPPYFVTSATKDVGREELLGYILKYVE